MKPLIVSLSILLWSAIPLTAQPLVSGKWLKARACKKGYRVLDLTSAPDGKRIPCAVATNFQKDGWSAKVGGVGAMMPPVEKLEQLLGRLGVTPSMHVVIVPPLKSVKSVAMATRIYWTLKVLGHEKVSILDGGVPAFVGAGGELKAPTGPIKTTRYRAKKNPRYVVELAELQRLRKKGTPLVDARPRAFYLGKKTKKGVARAGTIPGSGNLSFDKLIDPKTKRFLTRKTAGKLFSALKLKKGTRVFFCNTGNTASVDWFVSSELLGHKKSRLYDGSMMEWAKDPRLPVKK